MLVYLFKILMARILMEQTIEWIHYNSHSILVYKSKFMVSYFSEHMVVGCESTDASHGAKKAEHKLTEGSVQNILTQQQKREK